MACTEMPRACVRRFLDDFSTAKVPWPQRRHVQSEMARAAFVFQGFYARRVGDVTGTIPFKGLPTGFNGILRGELIAKVLLTQVLRGHEAKVAGMAAGGQCSYLAYRSDSNPWST